MVKQAVQFSKKKRTKYRYQKLKMCMKCNRYSVLKDEVCPACGTKLTGLESLVHSIVKKRLFTEAVWILIIASIGIIAAPTLKTLYYSLIAGLLFCVGYIALTVSFFKTESFTQLKMLLRSDLPKIKAGIKFDSELAKEDTKAERLVPAYEKLREIGDVMMSDTVKIRRVMILNEIILRSDMELELEPLIPSVYDRDFVKYALEVLKVNRSLFTKKGIAYFVQYRDQVVQDFGVASLVSVAGTALRMKLYIHEFSGFIEEFLDYFPKEQILRLCQIIHDHPGENWGSLGEKTMRLVGIKFHYDPDFKRFVS